MEKKPQPLKVFFRKTYLNDVAVYTQQIEDILAVEPYGIHAIDHQHTWRVGTTWACRWLRLVCTQQCTLIHNKYLCINNGLVTTVSGHFLKRITENWKQNEIRKKKQKHSTKSQLIGGYSERAANSLSQHEQYSESAGFLLLTEKW